MEDNHEKNVEPKIFTHVMQSPAPPPINLSPSYRNLQEWLLSLCDEKSPDKKIDTYNFGLFESANGGYTISLVGENTYKEGENFSSTRIEFMPSVMHFKLPESEYENLNRDQVLVRLVTELKEFVQTEQFRNSFFAEGNTIRFSTTGQIIWSKH